MDLTAEMYLVTGLAALGLGTAMLAGDRRSARSRAFAGLCAAIALWCLAIVARRIGWAPVLARLQLHFLGACAIAPVALHFTLLLARRAQQSRVRLGAAYAAAGLVWLSSLTQLRAIRPAWNVACIAVLGVILGAALVVLAGHARRSARGHEAWLWRLLVAVAILAAVLGLSDLLPRPAAGLPRLGPIAVLMLLLVLCLVAVRSRVLDVNRLFARGVALLIASAAAALVLQAAIMLSGPDPVVIFVVSLAIVAASGPFARLLSTSTEALIDPGRRPVIRALAAASRELQSASEPEAIRRLVDSARAALPDDMRLVVHAIEGAGTISSDESGLPADSALGRRLARDREALVRMTLADEIRCARGGPARSESTLVLAQLETLGLEIAAPLLRDDRLVGWIGLGGGRPERYVSAEVAATLVAIGFQAVATLDRLEAQELARRRQALAAVGEMAAGLAHEVRNPVGAIRGAAQVLSSARDPAQAQEMLAVIEEETDRLGRVVGEFLDYARPGAPRREAVAMGDLARRVLRDADAAGLGLHSEVIVRDGAGPAAGDRFQLQRALANLVRNARDAAGQSGTVRIEISREGTDRIALRVQDDGPGIPASVMSRLFAPFQTTKPQGTGLGLALVHRVVSDHGGEVRVEAGEGRGAAFTLILPAWMHDGRQPSP